MTIEQMRHRHQPRPFRAFRVHMADRHDLDVEHPELPAHTPTGRTITIARLDERFGVVDPLLATSFEPISGSARRRKQRK